MLGYYLTLLFYKLKMIPCSNARGHLFQIVMQLLLVSFLILRDLLDTIRMFILQVYAFQTMTWMGIPSIMCFHPWLAVILTPISKGGLNEIEVKVGALLDFSIFLRQQF